MATIKDVARMAGVSISTVSRVINNPESVIIPKRNAVRQAMSSLNYQPNGLARALVNSKTNCIGLMVGEFMSAFFSPMMQGIDRLVLDAGKHIMITSGNNQEDLERGAVNNMLQHRCDGLILHSKALPDEELRKLARNGQPVIFMNRLIADLEDQCVYLDNVEGACIATRHLIEHGHRDIAFISSGFGNVVDGHLRRQGYLRALADAGIASSSRLQAVASPDEQGGYQAVKTLLSRKKPFTALFAYNDQMAVGALNALEDSGYRVPTQVSIIGFDDIPIARYIRPGLTTIRYPVEDMAVLACQALLHRITPERFAAPQGSFRFSPELIQRDSVAPVRI